MMGGPTVTCSSGSCSTRWCCAAFGVAQASTTVGSVSQCVIAANETRTECSPDDPLAPGAAAGIRPGDRIVSMDGASITSWEQATAVIRKNPGNTLSVVVERDGAEVTLSVTQLLTERYVVDSHPVRS